LALARLLLAASAMSQINIDRTVFDSILRRELTPRTAAYLEREVGREKSQAEHDSIVRLSRARIDMEPKARTILTRILRRPIRTSMLARFNERHTLGRQA
jgi:hypothetical protein